jgi:hypothetical protein
MAGRGYAYVPRSQVGVLILVGLHSWPSLESRLGGVFPNPPDV